MSQTESLSSSFAPPSGRCPSQPARETSFATLPEAMSLDERLIQIEFELIAWAMDLAGGNKTRAAEILKIKRSTLGDRINRCRLNGYAL